jgi:hypothetical protein
MPQFLDKAVQTAATAARGAWMAGPWRVLRPLHALGERAADKAAERWREEYPQYYLQGVLGAGVAGVAAAIYAIGTALGLATPLLAAASVFAAALPAAGIVALAAGATVAIGAARQSARRTEKYFLYEKSMETLEDLPVPPPEMHAPALQKVAKDTFNTEAEPATEQAIKPLKPIALKKGPEVSA